MLSIIILTISLSLSLFFSACETAFTSLQTTQVTALAAQLKRKGRILQSLYRTPNRILATVLIGNNLANILASVTATRYTIQLFGDSSLGIMTGLLTLVILIFCEIIPKQFALQHSEGLVRRTVYPLYGFFILLYPVLLLLSLVTEIFTGKRHKGESSISFHGVLHMLNHAHQTGILNQAQTRIIRSGIAFSELSADTIMTHRKHVRLIAEGARVHDAIVELQNTHFAQFPVYRNNKENIVGIISAKRLLGAIPEETIASHMEVPAYIPVQRDIQDCIRHFSGNNTNKMLIVLDEYGGFSGIITFRDIMHRVLGTQEQGSSDLPFEKISENLFSIRADTPISLLRPIFPLLPKSTRHARTIGGFLIYKLGRIPNRNEKIITELGSFTVEAVKKTQIVRILYEKNDEEQ